MSDTIDPEDYLSGYMNYPGDQRSILDMGRPLGPTQSGEWLWPVEAVFNAESNRTRVRFSLHPPGSAG